MYEQVIYGVLTGVGYSIMGWQKEAAKNDTLDFDWIKLSKSIVICSIVGGIAGYTSTDFNIVIVGSAGITATNLVNISWKIIDNRWLKKKKKKKK